MAMLRRALLALAVPVLVAATIVGGDMPEPGTAAAQAPPSRPNIVLVMTDDQEVSTLQYMAAVQAELVGKGITFTNGLVNLPLVLPVASHHPPRPERQQHRHPRQHRSDGRRTHPLPPLRHGACQTVATVLRAAGYRTGYVGKYLNEYPGDGLPDTYVPPGWDYWAGLYAGIQQNFTYGLNRNGRLVPASQNAHVEQQLATEARTFLDGVGNRPFLLMVWTPSPHSPYEPEARYTGTAPGLGARRVLRTPAFNEVDITDKPELAGTTPVSATRDGHQLPAPGRGAAVGGRHRRADPRRAGQPAEARQHLHRLHVGQRLPPRPAPPDRQGPALRRVRRGPHARQGPRDRSRRHERRIGRQRRPRRHLRRARRDADAVRDRRPVVRLDAVGAVPRPVPLARHVLHHGRDVRRRAHDERGLLPVPLRQPRVLRPPP